MSWTAVKEIKVGLDIEGEPFAVGRLAARDRRIYFEYDRGFLARGFDLSPLRLPLEPGVKSFEPGLFEGLPGLFNDSLPDGWGRLLLDRALRAKGVAPGDLTPLDRLAFVGQKGMGALVYEPDIGPAEYGGARVDLDRIAAEAQQVLEGAAGDVLQKLIELNGSSAGARPKAMIGVDEAQKTICAGGGRFGEGFVPWLVKFPNTADGADAGAVEYVYALMAKEAALEISEARLFPAKGGAGYFGTRRFDREGAKRIHVHTASGLLHADFRIPSLDYEDLIALTQRLTRDRRETEKMFRLAVFNVLAHNRDDHARNFSFLMKEDGEWRFAPAYDLTFASGPGGEQTTMVMGEGRAPGKAHLLKLAEAASIEKKRGAEIIDRTRAALANWKRLAKTHGVARETVALVGERLRA